jgi:hypothetical protein
MNKARQKKVFIRTICATCAYLALAFDVVNYQIAYVAIAACEVLQLFSSEEESPGDKSTP